MKSLSHTRGELAMTIRRIRSSSSTATSLLRPLQEILLRGLLAAIYITIVTKLAQHPILGFASLAC